MLLQFEPLPDYPRFDDETWHLCSELQPPIGQEFEFYHLTEGTAAEKPCRAMLRQSVERRNGKIFYTSSPMIVTDDNRLIGFGFGNPEKVMWRLLGIIDHR